MENCGQRFRDWLCHGFCETRPNAWPQRINDYVTPIRVEIMRSNYLHWRLLDEVAAQEIVAQQANYAITDAFLSIVISF
jgi:hypothetical protein